MNVRLSKPLITDHIKTYPTLKDNNDQLISPIFKIHSLIIQVLADL